MTAVLAKTDDPTFVVIYMFPFKISISLDKSLIASMSNPTIFP